MEISNPEYDVIRTANLRRSGGANIQPSKRYLGGIVSCTSTSPSKNVEANCATPLSMYHQSFPDGRICLVQMNDSPGAFAISPPNPDLHRRTKWRSDVLRDYLLVVGSDPVFGECADNPARVFELRELIFSEPTGYITE
jgi:hypothetical protein